MQNILDLSKTNKLILAAFAFLAVLAFSGGRAHAATLNVSGGCTLNEAITSINTTTSEPGCSETGTYGTDDTIMLPSGTITLSADLPSIINKSVKVIGAGKDTTTIDADGYKGFYVDPDIGAQGSRDHTFKDFTITGADEAGILSTDSGTATLDSVVVTDSTMGVYIRALHLIVTNSNISNNTNNTVGDWIEGAYGGSFAGLGFWLQAASSSDIPSVDITDSVISNNSSESAGLSAHLFPHASSGDVNYIVFNIERTTVSDNNAEKSAGIIIAEEGGTIATTGVELTVHAVTVSGNSVEVVDAEPVVNPLEEHAYIAGMVFNGKLNSAQNLTNVTAANNTASNTVDNQLALAGFSSSLSFDSASLTFTNATIIGNEVIQTDLAPFYQSITASGINATFFVNKTDPYAPDIANGASAQNSLIAGNYRNGDLGSCIQGDKAALGLSGVFDLTPISLGNNITDDPNCTSYTVVSNILSTLGPLQNNGGPVETIALLDGSPAIASGGSVLGVTTDARGVSRPDDCPSVGAFQFEGAVCGASTPSTSGSGNAGAPNTGIKSVSALSAVVASILGLSLLGYTFSRKRV